MSEADGKPNLAAAELALSKLKRRETLFRRAHKGNLTWEDYLLFFAGVVMICYALIELHKVNKEISSITATFVVGYTFATLFRQKREATWIDAILELLEQKSDL